MTATSTRRARNLAAFVLLALIWGSTWLVIKDQLSVVPPTWSVTWRFLIAAIAMFALAAARGELVRLPPATLGLAALMGAIQFCLNFQLVYQAERYITSGLVALVFALMFVPNTLLGRVFLDKTVTRRFVLGSLIALGGIALLLVNEVRAAPVGPVAGGTALLGFALAGCAVLSASGANILMASPRVQAAPLTVLAWAMLFGTIADAAWSLLTAGPPAIELSLQYLGGVSYLALFGTVIAFPLYVALIRDWGPGPAAYNGVAVPIVAMTLSTLFEGYRWTALAAGGVALALAGLTVALTQRKTAA